MEQSPWKAYSHSSSQEMSSLLCRVHKGVNHTTDATFHWCEMWTSHGGEDSSTGLLGCDA